MFFIKEAGYSEGEPHFQQLPTESNDPKARSWFFFPEKETGDWFYRCGFNERALINWVTDTFITTDKVFVDIGAHIGSYTFSCAKKAVHTYAFECSPRTFCYLCANIALHGLEYKVTPHSCALGNRSGEISYVVRSEDGGGNGVKPLASDNGAMQRVTVQMRTLDSFGISNIGCIKIDVEGFEKEVLEGAVETLRRSNWPPILFESWGTECGAEKAELHRNLFAYLAELGYQTQRLIGSTDMYLATHP